MKDNEKTTKQIEVIVSTVLQIGVSVSAIFIFLGIILFFKKSRINNNYRYYISRSFHFPHSFIGLFSSIKGGHPVSYIVLGVLLLILTPVLRVATSIFLFLYKKDIPMSLVTLFVLIILFFSFYLGFAT